MNNILSNLNNIPKVEWKKDQKTDVFEEEDDIDIDDEFEEEEDVNNDNDFVSK
jgi:hypothetical protein